MDNKEVRVSLAKPYTAYVGASKEILKVKGVVELQGLGEATSNVVRAAEMLCSLGYANLEKFETLTISEKNAAGNARNTSKVIIKLSKAANFDKVYADFISTRGPKKE
jgi:aromatic ring hydroxylase